ncbi:CheR family methyltransferase [Noviherbaspirillum galbum]|uniref:Methyltransferase n=1 Tax=Noviherbaspirillum galbum TaxID=2709383 RepID=A0A6B3SIM8_9BURK|nr:protein-glutamate O-methyltransferase CheR [Noviherbaspirillum galbum]NEX60553.1 methyltransferase [Noviherbaspirillum galbum]
MIDHLLTQKLRRSSGLTLEHADVRKAVGQRMRERGLHDRHAYLVSALSSQDELQALIEALVVPETWFFRDPDAFAAAVAFVRARLAQGRRPVRVLSLPCSTGEEPYSMAIALADAGVAPEDVVIEGMDISLQALEQARAARYGRNAFRSRDLGFRNRHFSLQGDIHKVHVLHDAIRGMVRFAPANLMGDLPLPGGWDIVFCRNLLIYFDEATQGEAIRRLASLIAEDGMLLVGHAEAPALLRAGFSPTADRRAFALQRPARADIPPESPPSPAVTTVPMVPTRMPTKLQVPRSQADRSAAPGARPAPPAQATPETPPGDMSDRPVTDLLEAGRALAEQGRDEDARRVLLDCLRADPESAGAAYLLGLISDRREDLAGAAHYLRRAVYLEPNHYDALCHLALVLERQGDAAGAASLRRRARRVYERGHRGAGA